MTPNSDVQAPAGALFDSSDRVLQAAAKKCTYTTRASDDLQTLVRTLFRHLTPADALLPLVFPLAAVRKRDYAAILTFWKALEGSKAWAESHAVDAMNAAASEIDGVHFPDYDHAVSRSLMLMVEWCQEQWRRR